MVDFTLCLNKTCPSRKLCYRAYELGNCERQAYCDFKVEEGKDRCDQFMPKRDWMKCAMVDFAYKKD